MKESGQTNLFLGISILHSFTRDDLLCVKLLVKLVAFQSSRYFSYKALQSHAIYWGVIAKSEILYG